MTTCPSCGIAGDNLGCPNHTYWGINPLPDSIPMPEQSAWASLYAEIGRLNVLLNERDKEIERLKGLMPPDDTSFVGQAWSPFAEKLRLERDALREEVVERDKEIAALKQTSADLCSECGWRFLVPGVGCQGCERARLEQEIEWLRGERPAVVAWLRQTSERMNDATLAHAADCIEDGEHRVDEEK